MWWILFLFILPGVLILKGAISYLLAGLTGTSPWKWGDLTWRGDLVSAQEEARNEAKRERLAHHMPTRRQRISYLISGILYLLFVAGVVVVGIVASWE